jgi:DNA-binding LytR/AlgR family response regulator
MAQWLRVGHRRRLLDIALPGTSGIELLKRIRSINPTTRVIMVSGIPTLCLFGRPSNRGLAYIEQAIRSRLSQAGYSDGAARGF